MRDASTWRQEQRPFDFNDLKGLLEIFLEDVNARFEPAAAPFFRHGRCAAITAAEVQLGLCGEASSDLASSFDLQQHPVYIFELNVDGLERAWDGAGEEFPSPAKIPAGRARLGRPRQPVRSRGPDHRRNPLGGIGTD